MDYCVSLSSEQQGLLSWRRWFRELKLTKIRGGKGHDARYDGRRNWVMGIGGLSVLIVLVLAIAELVKYVFFS